MFQKSLYQLFYVPFHNDEKQVSLLHQDECFDPDSIS